MARLRATSWSVRAGLYAFEGAAALRNGLTSYGEALWSAAIITTTPQYAAQTAEGRILTLVLAVYAFTVVGYFTAALASYLVGKDAGCGGCGAKELAALREEVAALRQKPAQCRRESAAPSRLRLMRSLA